MLVEYHPGQVVVFLFLGLVVCLFASPCQHQVVFLLACYTLYAILSDMHNIPTTPCCVCQVFFYNIWDYYRVLAVFVVVSGFFTTVKIPDT